MPLSEPPRGAGSLSGHPSYVLGGTLLARVWRKHLPDGTVRKVPWWFASVPAEPSIGGRFDLRAPGGTCYLAETVAAAVLEALQAHLTNLPEAELAARGAVHVAVPSGMPPAADLGDPAGVELGVTAAIWAGPDQPLTQRWAAAFRRDGWWALYAGIQHDPSGQLRGVAVFDHAGEHEPTHTDGWSTEEVDRLGEVTLAELAQVGVIVRGPGNLPWASLP